MSVVNLKSTLISNRDATPKILTDPFLAGGLMEEVQGSVKSTSGDSAGSTYRMLSVPSNARLSSLLWQADGLGSSCIVDVGVYYPTQVPTGGANFLAASLSGTLISSSIFAAGLSGASAVPMTDITNQSGNYTIAAQETPMWSVLGLSADPELTFDIGISLRSATAATGYVGLRARYQY